MEQKRNVTVLGIGKSGFESAVFLARKGYSVFVSELKESQETLERAAQLRGRGIDVETGKHDFGRIIASDWVLISPGISPQTPVYQAIRAAGVPIYSEIEVASWFCPSKRIIAVTGSAGKTTVTTLITRVLQEHGYPALSCGNIGNPWISEISHITRDHFVVLELSSFQLQHVKWFHAHVGVLLNIVPNHQDWHKDMQEYADAKLAVFGNQDKADYAFVREEDRNRFFADKVFLSHVILFGAPGTENPNEEVVRGVTALFGVSEEHLNRVFRAFAGIEHRLELVAETGGVRYINDSKSTTPASLEWALKKSPAASVHLIAGGIAKSKDHGNLHSLIREKAKALYLIGKAATWLAEVWNGAAPVNVCRDLADALEKASASAVRGDSVLLSPACSSFDMFKSYEDRGTQFKEWVRQRVRSRELEKLPG